MRSSSRTVGLAALFTAFAVLVGAGAAIFVAQPIEAAVSAPVVRAAFYYPWFPKTWGHQPSDPFTVYHPSSGYYSSDSSAVIARQIAAMRYAHLDAAIVSWWGQGQQGEAARIPLILGASASSSFKDALYYEKEGYGDPSVGQLSADLTYIQTRYSHDTNYLTESGKPVIMAFSDKLDSCAMVTRWKQANAGRFFVVLKVFPGYRSCADQPDGWHQYGPAAAQDSQAGYSFSISPGYWRKGDPQPRLVRDPARWAADIRNMVATNAPFQLVTSFNEWGEGTAVEASNRMSDGSPGGWSSPSGYGTYLDELHALIPDGLVPSAATATTTRTVTTATSRTQTTSRQSTTSTTRSASSTASSSTTAPTTPPKVPGSSKVLVIMEENHTSTQVKAQMPYLVSLQKTYGLTTHYTAATHPSLPNYLEIAGGSTFGVTDDKSPSSHPIKGTSVFGAALARGKSARTYSEAMTSNCQTSSHGLYAARHNPWVYFVDERAACRQNDVPLTALTRDINSGTLPNVGMLTPNLCNDAHNCSLRTADAFLKLWFPRLMGGPDYKSGKLSIVVTFDEGVGSNQTISAAVINPSVHRQIVGTALNHAGLSRWLYQLSGSKPRNHAATATNFGAAFGL